MASLRTERFSPAQMADATMAMYQRNSTAVGVVAVYDEGDRFEYEVSKRLEPDVDWVSDFVRENEDSKWLIIHARLATSGDHDSLDAAHPIKVNGCEECTSDMVLHNGALGDLYLRNDLKQEGHEFNTEVDTETIAHAFGSVPETIEEADQVLEDNLSIRRQYGFILLGRKRMYFYSGFAYEINEIGEMYRTRRAFSNSHTSKDYSQLIMKAEA